MAAVTPARPPPSDVTGAQSSTRATCTAVDDHARLACAKILADERNDSAAGFWQPARRLPPAVSRCIAEEMARPVENPLKGSCLDPC
jgi:hypothetical protein